MTASDALQRLIDSAEGRANEDRQRRAEETKREMEAAFEAALRAERVAAQPRRRR